MKMSYEQYDELKKRGLTHEQIASASSVRGIDLPSESLLGSVVKPVAKAAARIGQLAGVAGIKAFGNEEQYQQALAKTKQDSVLNAGPFGQIKIEGQKGLSEGGAKQIGADVLENASILAPYGRVAGGITGVVGKVAPKLAGTAGWAGAGALGGYAMDVAETMRGNRNDYTPGAMTAVGGGLPLLSPMAKAVGSLTKFATVQATGLERSTVETLLTNPKALTEAQKVNLDRATLANQVKTNLSNRLRELSHTGGEYDAIRQSGQKLSLTEDIPTKVLNKFGVSIKNGNIVVGPESTPLKVGDRNAIEDFIAQYGGAKDLSANGVLNIRKALDNMAQWDSSKSDISKTIAKTMRKEYDDVAKTSIKGLKELDEKFAPEKKLLSKLRKELFDAEGNLKDAAINKIANSTGKGKDQFLSRLEQIAPNIGQKVQIVKALEDIGATQGNKVGTYFRAGNLFAGTAGAMAGGPVGFVLSAVASTPMVAVPIIKTVGRVRGWSDDSIARLVSKITTGKSLSDAELVMFKSAMRDHLQKVSPGDQLLDDINARRNGASMPLQESKKGMVPYDGNLPQNIGKVNTVDDFFDKKPLTQRIKETLTDQTGSIANPFGKGMTDKQIATNLKKSSDALNRINQKAVDRVEEYLDWASGVKKVSGDDLMILKADAQLIGEQIGIKTNVGDKELANNLRGVLDSRLGKGIVPKAPAQSTVNNQSVSSPKSIAQAKASGMSFDEWVSKVDVKNNGDFKKWAGQKNTIEVFHGSPEQFDRFKLGNETYNTSGQPTSGISFADNFRNAEPFSRQYSGRYHDEYKKISDKYETLYREEIKKTGLSDESNRKLALKISNGNATSITSEDADVIIRYRGKKDLRTVLSENELSLLEEIAYGNKKTINKIKAQKETEIKKLDKKYENEGKVYRAYLKGDVVEVDGEDIGFGATRNEIVDNLKPNEILKINNADTGQYIGTEYMTNNPDNIFLVNAGKTRSQLKAEWDAVK